MYISAGQVPTKGNLSTSLYYNKVGDDRDRDGIVRSFFR